MHAQREQLNQRGKQQQNNALELIISPVAYNTDLMFMQPGRKRIQKRVGCPSNQLWLWGGGVAGWRWGGRRRGGGGGGYII